MNKAHPHLEPYNNGHRKRHNHQIYSFIIFNLKLSFSIRLGWAAPLILMILLLLRANNYILAEVHMECTSGLGLKVMSG